MKLLIWIRSALAALLFVFHTIFWSILAVIAGTCGLSRRFKDFVAAGWAGGACKIFNVKLEIKGLEKIPQGGCLFLFNHTSFFDIFSLQAAVPNLRFGAKIELFRIPIFGTAIAKMGALPIARHNRSEVFRIYEEATKRFQAGEKFALSPEGTRNHEEALKTFKSGPFIFAINGQVPVVPVVIHGARDAWRKGRLLPNTDSWSRTVRITFLDPVPTSGLKIEDKQMLSNKVFQQMLPFFPATKIG